MPLVPTSPRTCAHRDAEFRQRPGYQVGKASHNYRGLHWHLNLLNRLGAKLRQQMACAADGGGGKAGGVASAIRGVMRGSLPVLAPGELYAAKVQCKKMLQTGVEGQ